MAQAAPPIKGVTQERIGIVEAKDMRDIFAGGCRAIVSEIGQQAVIRSSRDVPRPQRTQKRLHICIAKQDSLHGSVLSLRLCFPLKPTTSRIPIMTSPSPRSKSRLNGSFRKERPELLQRSG